MPFKSVSQQKFLYSQKPDVAEKFAEHTPKSDYKNLPERVGDKNKLKEYTKKHRRQKDGK